MSLRRYCGMAIVLGFGLAFNAVAQDVPPAAEVTAAPETEAAPVMALSDSNEPAMPGDASAGESKSAVCGACHGSDGNSPVPMYPKLAGQSEAYIARQLSLYKDGSRVDPIMVGFASTLSTQDMRDIGAFFATKAIASGIADDSAITDGPNAGMKFYEVGQKLYRGGDTVRSFIAVETRHAAFPPACPAMVLAGVAIQAAPIRPSAGSMRPIRPCIWNASAPARLGDAMSR